MNVSQQRSIFAFQKLGRQVCRLSDKPTPERVHRFRTLSRRVEAVLIGLVSEPAGNDKKLLLVLRRLRKKAGKVRDLDVQILALRNLRVPQDRARKAELLQALCTERQKRERRLASVFDKKTIRELERRLKRASKQFPSEADPLQCAISLLEQLTRDPSPIGESTLHRYRVLGKRVRYLAEQCPDAPQAREIVSRFTRVQDAIGDWHDWLKLSEKASQFFQDAPGSGLLSTLRAITRNKFLQAADALARARSERVSPVEGKKSSRPAPPLRAHSASA
jgi:CHAD domain-containing protein